MSDGETTRASRKSGRDRRTSRDLQPAGTDRRQHAKDRRDDENVRFVTFRVAGWLLGIRVERVQEVLVDRPITVVPLGPPELAGLLNLRGHVITVVDLRTRLGLESRPPEAKRMSLVIRDGGEMFSLMVDSVGDVMDVAASAIKEPPSSLTSVWRSCCEGVARLDAGVLLAALDVSRILIPSDGAASSSNDSPGN